MTTLPRTLADHPAWLEAKAELRAIFAHMTEEQVSSQHLVRKAGSAVWPRALVAAVMIETVSEMVRDGPTLARTERRELAEACHRLADLVVFFSALSGRGDG